MVNSRRHDPEIGVFESSPPLVSPPLPRAQSSERFLKGFLGSGYKNSQNLLTVFLLIKNS